MKIYFGVDIGGAGGATAENLKRLMHFLQEQGHTVCRASYIFSKDPDSFLQEELGLDRKPTHAEEREAHMKWVDDADLFLADVSTVSEGRSMMLQRTIDKTEMGMPKTPIILIKDKKLDRKFGSIMKGIIESGKAVYFEYANIEEVIKRWPELLKKALKEDF